MLDLSGERIRVDFAIIAQTIVLNFHHRDDCLSISVETEKFMRQELDTIRELSVAELDQVGGGQSELSVSVGGLNELIDTVHSIPAGAVSNVRGLVENLAGGLLGALGGATKSVTDR